MKGRACLLLFGVFFFWSVPALLATTFNWTGGGGPPEIWSNSFNWSPLGPPGTGDSLVFNNDETSFNNLSGTVRFNTISITDFPNRWECDLPGRRAHGQ